MRRGSPLLYLALVPAIVVAVVILGAVALRTTIQVERARQQTVIEATLALANDRADRLDKLIVSQDNAVLAHVEEGSLATLSRRWLPNSARETPTVRAIVIIDAESPDREVVSFTSARAPTAEDDAFRRTLLTKLWRELNFAPPVDELRHLHMVAGGQSMLVSYWQRTLAGRRHVVVAWHEVPRIVHDVLPSLFKDTEVGSRMNVIDEDGRIVFGPPVTVGELTVGRPFPTTLYNWRLQVALTSAEDLRQKAEKQRLLELAIVGFAGLVAIAGIVIVVVGAMQERRVAQLKSDFVANVSHELKTPLALVRMFGELLLLDRVTTDEKRKQYLGIIVSESERLTALIENVLDFAKVERGKAAYELAPTNLVDVVTRAVEVYRYRAEREGVEVRVTTDESVPTLSLDARALELAVINLLDNALKYGKEGGVVDVAVRARQRGVEIEIADRGPGIEPEEQARIFERFVRGRRASEHQVRGSGIGLALVKHIAEAHGGSVRVKSPTLEGTHGSSFTIRLPAPSRA